MKEGGIGRQGSPSGYALIMFFRFVEDNHDG